MSVRWLLAVVVLVLTTVALHAAEIEPTVPPECLVDKELEADAPGNLVKCEDEPYTECCDRDGEPGCCDPSGDKQDGVLVKFGIICSCATVGLALFCFVFMWCRPDSFPCLATLKRRYCCCCDENRKNKVGNYYIPKELRNSNGNHGDNPDGTTGYI